jgi:FkbM family methyltransferase
VSLGGKYLRKNFRWIYFLLVSIINWFIRISTPYYIYITDSLGGSFKDYLAVPNNKNRIEALKKNLDKESIVTIDIIIKRLLGYPDEGNRHRISKGEEIIGGMLPVETTDAVKFLKNELKNTIRITKIPSVHITESVFYFHHGLRLFPQEVLNYIRNSDFIDAGAFNGDSAIALYEYGYRKIYSIEISRKSIEDYIINTARCNIASNRYMIINSGISSTDNEQPVTLHDTGSAGLSLFRKSGKYDEISVEKKSVDHLAGIYMISPRFIKADIEGSGLEFVKGAVNTLKKFRPVMSIAIYHNPVEFFEVKPYLENLLEDYVFMIRKLSSGVKNNECHSEVILLACPKEVLNGNQLKPVVPQGLIQ